MRTHLWSTRIDGSARTLMASALYSGENGTSMSSRPVIQ